MLLPTNKKGGFESFEVETFVGKIWIFLNILNVLIVEPTAAALAYGLDKKLTGENNILIYDLGGGITLNTLNNSIYMIHETFKRQVQLSEKIA